MKKIRSLKQLKKEKRMLRQRERELIRQINLEWQQLKENFRPQDIFGAQTNRCNGKDPGEREENVFKSIISFGAMLLVKKLVKRAEERFERYFN